MTQPFRKTFLPPNKFYSAVDIPSSADEAGASSSAPTPDAPADLSDGPPCSSSGYLCISKAFGGEWCVGKCRDHRDCTAKPLLPGAGAEPATGQAARDSKALGRTGDSISPTGAADLLQALGALSGTDLIHEIFAAKPKHFKLKHKLKLPRFAPDYEAMEAAMHNPGAPRALETDPVWADASPLFLRGRT